MVLQKKNSRKTQLLEFIKSNHVQMMIFSQKWFWEVSLYKISIA
jgi:hypothetical protein